MAYVEGFVVAVPAANKDAYCQQAAKALPLVKEFGVRRMVETWGDDVPPGKLTDFPGAVKATPDEVVVFSWFEYPDKAARQAANRKMMSDPRMKEIAESMTFDGKRMIHGGFEVIVDQGQGGRPGYVDGSLLAVPAANAEAYRDRARKVAAIILENGASRVVEAWGDDVPDGKLTDFKGAVKAKDDEKVVYCWVEWPSKQARDAGWGKIMQDERMRQGAKLYDGQRQVYGGFAPLLDS